MNDENLKKQVLGELQEMETAATFLQKCSQKWHSSADLEEQLILTSAIANISQGFYTGVERIFLEIAEQVDGQIPQGANWHRKLINQMSQENASRGAVISNSDLQAELEKLRKFRHVVRVHHAHRLKTNLVLEQAKSVPETDQALKRDLQNFCQSLEPQTFQAEEP